MSFELIVAIILFIVAYCIIGIFLGILASFIVHDVDVNNNDDMALYIIGWPMTIFIILGYGLAVLAKKIVGKFVG